MALELHDPNKMKVSDFLTDYNPLWHMLETLHDKILKSGEKRGLQALTQEEIWKRVYEFGVVSQGLEKADMQERINYLNEQNVKWFSRADSLEAEVTLCRKRIQELEALLGASPEVPESK